MLALCRANDEDQRNYDLGYFDDETYGPEPIANPFSPRVRYPE